MDAFEIALDIARNLKMDPVVHAQRVDYSGSKLVIGRRGRDELWKRMQLRRDANARDRRMFRRMVRNIERAG